MDLCGGWLQKVSTKIEGQTKDERDENERRPELELELELELEFELARGLLARPIIGRPASRGLALASSIISGISNHQDSTTTQRNACSQRVSEARPKLGRVERRDANQDSSTRIVSETLD